MPPITPEPSHHHPELVQVDAQCRDQHAAAPAHRDDAGLARAGALEPAAPQRGREPRNTKNSVYIQPSVEIFQSQVVVNSSAKKPTSLART
jgi:hypothetical protein